jgi:hypothetical protein
MTTAGDAFEAWLLKIEIVGGAFCLLIFAVCVAVAVVLVARSRRKDE